MKEVWVLWAFLLVPIALAVDFSLGGGMGFAAGSAGGGLQGSLQFTAKGLVDFPPASLDLRAGLDGAAASGFSATFSLSPLLAVNLHPLRLYAGPTLGMHFSSLGVSGPLHGLLAGFELPAGGVNAFAEASLAFNGPSPGFGVRGGVSIGL